MKQIIILDTQQLLGVGTQLNVAFWFPVTVGQEVPTGATSQFRGIAAQELTDLQVGKFVEVLFSHNVLTGTGQAAIKAALITVYTNRKAIFDARPNPNQFYGLAFDGSVWA